VVTFVAAIAAVAGVLLTRIWRVGRLGITAVHEGGHAVAAVMAGHTVTAVHLRSDSSGVTYHHGKQRWISRVVTAGAGYTAPGLAAVAGAALIAHHETRVWLGILAGLGVVMVAGWVRNLFGIAVVSALVLALGWLLASGTSGQTVAVATFATWYLAIGGLRAAVEQFPVKGRGDGFELGRLLHVPAVLCRAGFVLIAAAALVGCTSLLLRG
jgi:Peptidase M50B-like